MKEKIRDRITKEKGKHLKFKYNGARNQIEEFDGYIKDVYSSVFTIKMIDNDQILKTYSYSDVLTETLEIFDK